jgi:ATP-binding cassette subfamily B protein
VELEAERRLLAKAASVDLGQFDNSEWHDRLARAKRDSSSRPGDLTWSILGLSGNVVTILLMTALLASLGALLVVLALGSAVLCVLLEGRVTTRLYGFVYNKTPEERERVYFGDLLVQPKIAKELRAYVLPDHLLSRHRQLSESLFQERAQVYRRKGRVSMFTGLATGSALAAPYVFVALRGIDGTIDREASCSCLAPSRPWQPC